MYHSRKPHSFTEQGVSLPFVAVPRSQTEMTELIFQLRKSLDLAEIEIRRNMKRSDG
jgi:hypothetical protein